VVIALVYIAWCVLFTSYARAERVREMDVKKGKPGVALKVAGYVFGGVCVIDVPHVLQGCFW
jgi:hypothetical protein